MIYPDGIHCRKPHSSWSSTCISRCQCVLHFQKFKVIKSSAFFPSSMFHGKESWQDLVFFKIILRNKKYLLYNEVDASLGETLGVNQPPVLSERERPGSQLVHDLNIQSAPNTGHRSLLCFYMLAPLKYGWGRLGQMNLQRFDFKAL